MSGGSILGDKTRMERLSTLEGAISQPAAAAGRRGERPRIHAVCEAAGYDVVLVETVGVGQTDGSERHVDMYVLLQLPNAGDDLQAIRRASWS